METGFTYEDSICTLKDGQTVVIRPIHPKDEARMRAFHRSLSERSVYYRYFNVYQLDQRITHDRLQRICHVDSAQEMAIVVERINAARRREIIGVGRLTRTDHPTTAEFAIIISDAWHGHGLGRLLLQHLITVARQQGQTRLRADILSSNRRMQKLVRKAGFKMLAGESGAERQAEMVL